MNIDAHMCAYLSSTGRGGTLCNIIGQCVGYSGNKALNLGGVNDATPGIDQSAKEERAALYGCLWENMTEVPTGTEVDFVRLRSWGFMLVLAPLWIAV